jgi:hypothetical protein
MLFAIASFLTLLAAYYGWRHRQLAVDGTTAKAISVEVQRETVSGKNPTGVPYQYFATYAFADADGLVHRTREAIGKGLYDQLSGAAPAGVPVHYSRSHPEVSTLSRQSPRNVALFLVLIAAGAWLAALLRFVRG